MAFPEKIIRDRDEGHTAESNKYCKSPRGECWCWDLDVWSFWQGNRQGRNSWYLKTVSRLCLVPLMWKDHGNFVRHAQLYHWSSPINMRLLLPWLHRICPFSDVFLRRKSLRILVRCRFLRAAALLIYSWWCPLGTAFSEELFVEDPKDFASFVHVIFHPIGRFFTDKSLECFFRLLLATRAPGWFTVLSNIFEVFQRYVASLKEFLKKSYNCKSSLEVF